MDRMFFEDTSTDGVYKIACVDKGRIFSSSTPGVLANVFECSMHHPTINDRSQIFHALAPEIKGMDWTTDLKYKHRTPKLNHWSINSTSISPLSDSDRIKLYSIEHTITPFDLDPPKITHPSLSSMIALSESLIWKTGILQRCIDYLIFPEHRKQAIVYAQIDKFYRHILRFKLETESDIDAPLLKIIRSLTHSLGLTSTHDSTQFHTISEESVSLINEAITMIPAFDKSIKERESSSTPYDFLSKETKFLPMGASSMLLSHILSRWSGSRLTYDNGIYQIHPDPEITKALSYMDVFPPVPDYLIILEAPI